MLLTNGVFGWISPEFAFCNNIVVHKMVSSVRRNLAPPTLIDACVKDWTMQWSDTPSRILLWKIVVFAILSCGTGKKQTNKFSRKSSYSATLTVIFCWSITYQTIVMFSILFYSSFADYRFPIHYFLIDKNFRRKQSFL